MKRNALLIVSVLAVLFLLFAQWIWLKQSVGRDKERYAYELTQSLKNMFGFYLSKETGKKDGSINIRVEPIDPKDLPKNAVVRDSFVSNQYSEDINMGNFLLGLLASDRIDNDKMRLEPLDSLFRKEYPHYNEISAYRFTLNKKDSVLRSIFKNDASQALLKDTTQGVNIQIPIGDGRTYNFKAHVIFKSSIYTKRQLMASVISGIAIMLISLLVFAELVLLNRRTKQLDTMQQKVIGIVHDLKSPLNYVFTMLDCFGRKETDDKKRLQYQTSKSRVKYLSEKIELMLSALRYSKNRININISIFNIIDVAKGIVTELKCVYNDKEIHFSTFPEKEFMLQADPLFMEAVLRNLIENAVKYSNEVVNISLNASFQKDNALICVKDDGVGISKENQKKIFTNFYRVEKASSLKSHGVGLAFAKQVIKAHHGNIRLESTVGGGSTFTITLPQQKNI